MDKMETMKHSQPGKAELPQQQSVVVAEAGW